LGIETRYRSTGIEPVQTPVQVDVKNRARINVSPNEFQRAALLTGKVSPAEVFRELVNMAEHRQLAAPVARADDGRMPLDYNRNPAQYNFDADQRSERKYWETRVTRAKALTAELHFSREVAKMDKTELELVIEAPKRFPEVPATEQSMKCYKCQDVGHWPSQCPKVGF